MSKGFLSGGLCPGVFVWGVFVLIPSDVQPDEPLDKTIPLIPGRVIGGGSTWEPECKTSFRLIEALNLPDS